MESKESGRHSKIKERVRHSTDRMVERKTSERRLNHGKVRHGPEQTKKMVRHGYTNKDGFENKRTTLVRRSTKKTQFEVKRSTPKAFLLLVVGSADREGQQM